MQQLEKQSDLASWHGRLSLTYEKKAHQTQVQQSYHQAPLNLQRPFYPEGPVCHSVMMHTAGGMVGGDRLSINVTLQPQTHALLTTTSAGKVYRSNGHGAQQTVQCQLDTNAILEWLPLGTIVFDQAQFRQTLQVELGPGAIFCGWDLTRFGRSARGERFMQGDWRSHTEIWQQGAPLWIDRQWLPGQPDIWESPHGLAGQPVVGSFLWVGQGVEPNLVQTARDLWQPTTDGAEMGVTRLPLGLVCRYRGPSSQAARQWFIQVWNLLRSTHLGRPACPPRVWPL
ncbi:urease accessory protein UreD [Acaryochloris marina]|uniref:Urease accessory protein UreD n=1 Tax=Acaryochloris marina (strain MBIC 11017) TaxID=329726 RepID=URED_ACAM1|nr:urease accessory protein UreD [Acaryochloris marina]B0C790.1 RecName: Full=Urease accessory protein UreD [Acaryochloris marina MBIC11017]ABW30067.1 urease accessory protein UreD [Acaryochloris marina MBIC11017]BDM78921.1 urease accessory protein UreD [Acaryochloris marina MBIC10699]